MCIYTIPHGFECNVVVRSVKPSFSRGTQSLIGLHLRRDRTIETYRTTSSKGRPFGPSFSWLSCAANRSNKSIMIGHKNGHTTIRFYPCRPNQSLRIRCVRTNGTRRAFRTWRDSVETIHPKIHRAFNTSDIFPAHHSPTRCGIVEKRLG